MENELEQVRRQVAEGRKLIAAQEDLIKLLKAQGKPTEGAEATLEMFRRSQATLENHLRSAEERTSGVKTGRVGSKPFDDVQ